MCPLQLRLIHFGNYIDISFPPSHIFGTFGIPSLDTLWIWVMFTLPFCIYSTFLITSPFLYTLTLTLVLLIYYLPPFLGDTIMMCNLFLLTIIFSWEFLSALFLPYDYHWVPFYYIDVKAQYTWEILPTIMVWHPWNIPFDLIILSAGLTVKIPFRLICNFWVITFWVFICVQWFVSFSFFILVSPLSILLQPFFFSSFWTFLLSIHWFSFYQSLLCGS